MTVSRPRTLRPFKLVLLVVLALVALVPLAGSEAATPDSGTISASNPVVMWTGPFKTPTGGGCNGPSNPSCDNYKLTIQPPTGTY